jgi:DNA-binding response OmpR family regulator
MAVSKPIKKRILLVDDSEDIGALIKAALTSHSVDQVRSLEEAQNALNGALYDLFIIDITLLDGNGFDLCVALNGHPVYSQTPKIILSANAEVTDKVYGFTCGADDYVTKPFHTIEFKARVERHFTRSLAGVGAGHVIEHPELALDMEMQQCHLLGENGGKTEVNLTQTEFRLLLTLLKNRGRVLSRRELEQAAWQSFGATIEKRGIDTHISHLRKKLGPLRDHITSVYGQGYTFKKVG